MAPVVSPAALGTVPVAPTDRPAARPRLRPELLVGRDDTDPESCVVEDPVTERFYRIGRRELALVEALDGRRDLRGALAEANRRLGAASRPRAALTPDDATRIVAWLGHERLLVDDAPDAPERTVDAIRRRGRARALRWLNLVVIRIALVAPDRFLARLLPHARPFLGRSSAFVWLAVVLSGCVVVLAHPERLTAAAVEVLYPQRWLGLLAVWLVIKIAHEIAHGLVCKHHGGHVHEAGVMLVLLLPVGYVDATSSWRFPSRWQRAHVAAAGMLTELFLAGIAAWVWAFGPDGVASRIAFDAMLIASVSTLLFNANPLVRFDGYFILCDLLRIPNLYPRALRRLGAVTRRYLTGQSTPTPRFGDGRDTVVLVYGVAAVLWRCLVVVLLVVGAWTMLEGVGAIAAAGAVVTMVLVPTVRALSRLAADPARPSVARLGSRVGLPLALVAGTLVLVDWPLPITAPAVVEHDEPGEVRTDASGFVVEVRAGDGDRVAPGHPILVLANPALLAEVEALTAELEQSRLAAGAHLSAKSQAAYQAEVERATVIERRLTERRARVEGLTVRAPRGGVLLARDIRTLHGTHLALGTAVGVVVDPIRKRIAVSVDEADAGRLAPLDQARLEFRQDGSGARFPAVVERIEPRASTLIQHPMLAASGGGPIPVRAERGARGEDAGHAYLRPRLVVQARLDAEAAAALPVGVIGRARLPTAERSVGETLLRTTRDWLARVVERARDAAGTLTR
ncbi:MAG: HlyD family efflux transporter periplasmic adaptor subunit [Ectothiorhodospiraceae bacterium]|nr:HlyD family efflux transporter periplasmic adaptor subunit [Chromatiales bacterium]MCP5154227.1 HlyD family efflux transporter periplasmic adaptor subunit [Ectothiorhodospiraceae bacterium]